MHEPIVILWWGSDLRALGPDGSVFSLALAGSPDPVSAILELIAGRFPRAQASRIVFHPDSLELREVACPRAGRGRLRRFLTAENHALDEASTIWACEPPRQGSEGWGTLLYFDPHSRLPGLVEGLERRGITVEGAWSLPSIVGSPSPVRSGTGALLAIVATGCRVLIFSTDANGRRLVRFHQGREFADDAAVDIATALALFENQEGVARERTIEDGTGADAVRDAVREQGFEDVSFADLLARARRMKPGGASDLLPRKAYRALRTALPPVAAVLGIILLLNAAWHVRAALRSQEARQQEALELASRHRRLGDEVASRLAIRDQIDRLEQMLGQLHCPRQREYDLLIALAQSVPKAISLQEVSVDATGLVVSGHVQEDPGGPNGPLAILVRSLETPDAPWIFSDASPDARQPAGPEFTLHGRFRPEGKAG